MVEGLNLPFYIACNPLSDTNAVIALISFSYLKCFMICRTDVNKTLQNVNF